MANKVFANGMEVACKQGSGKSVAAFPDVCFTPPQTPATPTGVPIPYPNTGFAKDTTEGTTTVMISGQEIMLSDKSYFKKSFGNEAGCAPKKGIVTGVNKGQVSFISWSMNVMVEGEGMDRHLDLTTHNDASKPSNSPIWPYIDVMSPSYPNHPCKGYVEDANEKCQKIIEENKNKKENIITKGKRAAAVRAICTKGNEDCREALKCIMTPYGKNNCCEGEDMKEVLTQENTVIDDKTSERLQKFTKDELRDALKIEDEKDIPEKLKAAVSEYGNRVQTGHHGQPVHMFMDIGQRKNQEEKILLKDWPGYNEREAPVICVSGADKDDTKEHGIIHGKFDYRESNALSAKGIWSYDEAADAGAESISTVTGCNKECIRKQLDAYHVHNVGASKPPVAKRVPVTSEDGKIIGERMPDLRANPFGVPLEPYQQKNVSGLLPPALGE